MSIYTDSGVTLFQDTAAHGRFHADADAGRWRERRAGHGRRRRRSPAPNSPMPIQSGALAGYAALRDTLAPQYQAQLDQIAGGLINAFAESDQSTPPTLPSAAGPLHNARRQPACPRPRRRRVSPRRSRSIRTSIPSQGGDVDPAARRRHLRSRQSGLHLQYDRRGELHGPHPAARRARLARRRASIPSAGLGASASLTDYANASVSWLKARTSRRATPRPIRTRSRPRRLRRCRTRPASISTRR